MFVFFPNVRMPKVEATEATRAWEPLISHFVGRQAVPK